jgi:peptidoglycan hydrolase-like protein with peptidoglycan-binding domain
MWSRFRGSLRLGADIVVDGHFGSTTRDALKAFQREHNLKVDGKLGVNDAKVFGQAIQAKDAQQAMTTLAQLNQRGLQLTDNKDGNNTSTLQPQTLNAGV